jgi:ribosomal protein S18 acetylase RimI-like enzyme
MPPSFDIRRAEVRHAPLIAPLFDAYRQFYAQPSDVAGAAAFVRERLERRESVIFMAVLGPDEQEGSGAEDAPNVVGFVQLYPMFTSVGMRRMWILNDLFVAKGARRMGVADALMAAAEEHARAFGAAAIALETQHANSGAQALYEARGWVLERDTRWYTLRL